MDNLSQENTEKEFEQNLVAPATVGLEGQDIEFDENIDIEEIQKILQKHMAENIEAQNDEAESENEDDEEEFAISEESLAESEEPVSVKEEAFFPQASQSVAIEVDPKAKKYVIYVDSENIEFIETLSINERKLIINKILKEQKESVAKQKRTEELNKFMRHAIVAAITVIIGFPLLYMLVNKSLEATIANYQQAQRNFGILYREQGKIKQQNMN